MLRTQTWQSRSIRGVLAALGLPEFFVMANHYILRESDVQSTFMPAKGLKGGMRPTFLRLQVGLGFRCDSHKRYAERPSRI
jgi:hypothetical protein